MSTVIRRIQCKGAVNIPLAYRNIYANGKQVAAVVPISVYGTQRRACTASWQYNIDKYTRGTKYNFSWYRHYIVTRTAKMLPDSQITITVDGTSHTFSAGSTPSTTDSFSTNEVVNCTVSGTTNSNPSPPNGVPSMGFSLTGWASVAEAVNIGSSILQTRITH